jgi:hypothetical protein
LGYRVTDLTAARNQAMAAKQELSVEAARLQSIQATRNSAVAGKMVPTSQVSYAK